MQEHCTTDREKTQAHPCPDCHGRGHTRLVWHTDDGSPPYVLRPVCPCQEEREEEAHAIDR